jgi:hypothetical protein
MRTVRPGLSSGPRLALTAILMAAFSLALFSAARRLPGESAGEDLVFLAIALLAGVAIGGALGARAAGTDWPELTLSAVLSALLFMAVVWLFVPGFFPPAGGSLRDVLQAAALLFILASAGVFALPLADPLVRSRGPAPRVWLVALVALGLTAGLFLVDYLAGSGFLLGLIVFVGGSVVALALAGAGLALALFQAYAASAWSGGLGLLLWVFAASAWYLAGKPWFP